ncbi:DM13 domain-containing protein [Streptomyces sp. NBC_00094]|uniref:DM13 domain-containing protein n=1 Tax=Streptomyces sp. NBC_00094 TaxID=2903620 RepID=UPI00225B7AA9|nr:DM13 domain-containing protein [Streptomyces sp. NBC_00094]MCX5394030.1 DM13 domain-containing protein [Streptomyces sp. NBC_00094]
MERAGRRSLWAGLGIAVAIAVVAGLVWFKPWALWVDETVNEALPTAGTPATTPAASPTTDTSPSAAEIPTAPTGPVTLAQGTFISHEHSTTGTVKVVRLADGSHTLRLEGLDTSNGPDLRVWLSDAPVKEGKAGWGVFDDGRYVNLAKLKGNKGDQNYPLPAELDWSTYPSISIWCDRFDVSFGAAALART